MRRRVGLSASPSSYNRLISALFSLSLSTALVLIPVLPIRAAESRLAPAGARDAAPPVRAHAATAAPAAALVAPSLTATKTDAFSDPDGDGKAEPGQTITYTVTVTNNGPDDATGVVFGDTVDANTTLVPGSVRTQPVAAGDSYSVLGNVRIQPAAAAGLLANDCDADNGGSCSSAGLTASGPTTSAQGGNVAVNADGSFSYNPPAGYEGTDSFTYTVTDATGLSDTATATFTINDVVWFVDNSSAAAGDGRLTSPYNSLAPLNGAGGGGDPDESFDVIFVHEGNAAYGGGIALEDNQRLVGQGTNLDTALSGFGITVPPHSDARPAATGNPTIANAAGDAVALASNNAVLFVNAAASAAGASAIHGNAVGGTTTIAGANAIAAAGANGVRFMNVAGPVLMTGGSVAANSTGVAVAIDGGAAGVTFNNTSVSQSGGRVVDIQNRAGGSTVHFAGTSTVTGTNGATDAVFLLNNAATSAITFSAPISLSTTAAGARGLFALGGFTLNVATGSTVSSTGGPAVDIEDISANINFSTTFSTNSNGGGLRVEGVSGSASFGTTTINVSAATGVVMADNSAAITFSDLDIAPAAGQRALHATNNAGAISSTSGEVSATNATAVEIAGASAAARTPLNVRLTSVSASGGPNGIVLLNTSAAAAGASAFRVNGTNVGACTFADTSGCTGGTISGTAGSDGATAGAGVRLDNAEAVVLARMHVSNNSNFAIRGTNVNGFVLDTSVVGGANGTTVGAPFNEGSISFDGGGAGAGLFGASAIINSDVRGGLLNNLRVVNSAGTLSLSVSGSAFNGAAGGGDSVFVGLASTATAFVGVTGSAFTAARGNHVGVTLAGTSVGHLTLTGNTLSGGHASPLGQGIFLIGSNWDGVARYNISNNQMTGTRQGGAIHANKGSGNGDMQGTISGNTIGNATIALSGASASSGIVVGSRGAGGLHTALVSNNQIRQFNEQGIDLQAGEDGGAGDNTDAAATSGPASALNVTVTGNTVGNPGPLALHGIHLNSGVLAGDNNQVCADIGGIGAQNNVANGGNEPGGGFDIRPRQRQATRVQLPGYGGAPFDNAAVNAYLTGRNNLTSILASSQNAAGTANDGFVGGLGCAQPAAATPPTAPALASLDAPAVNNNAGRQLAAQSGFSADRGFFGSNLWPRKTDGGFAYSERAQSAGTLAAAMRPATAATTTAAATLSGETVNVNIGTLRAGDSVTITFQVTVANTVPAGTTQVSNQGTVTATGIANVLTDDPTEPGANDPTVTPLLLPPTIKVNDATVAEPAGGAANMLFTVTLSHPYSQTVTVDYDTANGGANPATAGSDYDVTSGTVSFNAGQTVKTIAVPVNADGTAAEGDEHFLVSLSDAVNGTVGDGTATGTITDETVASAVIISELRTSGPAGAGDDFVELLNTTDADVTVPAGGWALVASGSACADTPAVAAVIPAGAVIPARGNYLLKGSAYSLAAYAAGDQTLAADIADDRNVGLFAAGDLASISSANRLDAVGFGGKESDNCDLLREGTTLTAAAGSTSEYSFVRKVEKGLTLDTTDNAADFVLVSTTPAAAVGAGTPTLGAPGPEGSADERGPVPCSATAGAAKFGRDLIDTSASAASAPNTIRDTNGAGGTLGTLEFRRTFTNNTGAAVTALRFRAVDLSTFPAAAGAADLRALSSAAAGGAAGTTLDTPPAQALGGGVNSSLSVALATPLAAGASVSLRFLFGVEQAGDYEIEFVLESSPASGKDIWKLAGHTENGGHTDGGCNKPPVANAGADITAECSAGQASVTLDGSASTDPDGDTPLTFQWKEGATLLGTGQTLSHTFPLGSHTVTLTVTDPSGDSSQDTVAVNVVDTAAPAVTAPADVTAHTGPGATSCSANVANLGTATAEDSCEGSLAVTATRSDNQPLNAPYPVGPTTITYTATDAAGHTGTDTQTLTVIDNTAPVVTAPADVTAPNDPGSCSANVNPGTATATDNCSVQSVTGARSDNQPLDAAYPVGTTTITWTATDASGNTATDTQTVTVQDTQKPSLLASVAVALMGPPFNHALINVGLAATASDNCPGLGAYQVSVFSDEDDGAGPHSPDATNIGVGSLKLRRERDGAGDGRVYLVVVKVTDAYGNTSASCSTVGVPLSNSSSSIASVNAQAASAASFCSANNGSAPAGFFAVGP